ncbi:YfhO family protein [bacterium]|nr:YfhO family protein [bacterium]
MRDSKKMQTALKLGLPPLLTLLLLSIIYYVNGVYPFGPRSISWSDMTHQIVPLLNSFKDILDGKASLFMNMHNSGLNFYGIFFYHLSSPFTFLVKFVDKENMIFFVGILTALKLSVCAFTAAFCFQRCRGDLDAAQTVILSMMYPFCGYAMMYYVGLMWLDVMYLFPLLILSLLNIIKGKSAAAYAVILTLCCLANYYMAYMIAVFVLIFAAVWPFIAEERQERSAALQKILCGSLAAALVSCIVWLPCFIQYYNSGRSSAGITANILQSPLFFANYQTSLPILMGTAWPLVIIAADLFKKRKREKEHKLFLILWALTLVPFALEPVDLLWHGGSYWCFPCRFGYITVFLSLLCAAYSLAPAAASNEECKSDNSLALAGVWLAVSGLLYGVHTVLDTYREEAGSFIRELWGSGASLECIAVLFAMTAAAYALLYCVRAKGLLSGPSFVRALSAVFLIEASVSAWLYPVRAAELFSTDSTMEACAYTLSDKISDSAFFRVKSCSLTANNNFAAAAGYNSVSLYTSLSSQDYILNLKRLGCSSVEVNTSSAGGTPLTDALLSLKYELRGGRGGEDTVYQGKYGYIRPLPAAFPPGLFFPKGSLDKAERIPEELERCEVQSYLSQALLHEDIVGRYFPPADFKKDGLYKFSAGQQFDCTLQIEGREAIYLDLFDKPVITSREPIFGAMEVKVGEGVWYEYPSAVDNGFLFLGNYQDQEVKVSLRFNRDVVCRSFGIFGLNLDRFAALSPQVKGFDTEVRGSGLRAAAETAEACAAAIIIPYSDSYKLEINGKGAEYKRVFSDFIAFDLPAGRNEISITFIPEFFVCAAWISLAGLLLSIVWFCRGEKRLEENPVFNKALGGVMLAAAWAASAAVYIASVLIKLLA